MNEKKIEVLPQLQVRIIFVMTYFYLTVFPLFYKQCALFLLKNH